MSRTFTQRTELRFLYLALAFVLALAALVAFPDMSQATVEVLPEDFAHTVVEGPDGTFTVTEIETPGAGDGISHVTLTVDACGEAEISVTPDTYNYGSDGSLGVTGYKWEGTALTLPLVITVTGLYDSVTIYVKAGNGYEAHTFDGPGCEDPVEPSSLTLKKLVVNDDGGTAVVGDFGIVTSAGSLSWGPGTVDESTSTTTYVSNTIGNLSAGTFTFSENDVAGYSEGDWSCTIFRLDQLPTISEFDEGSLEIDAGENWICSITNNDVAPSAASLTLVKVVVNDDGGTAVVDDFGIETDAGTLTGWDIVSAGDWSTTYASNTFGDLSAGPYSFSEKDVAGYTEGSWSCEEDGGEMRAGGAFGLGSLTIAEGEDWTCSILNDDVAQPVVTEDVLNLSIVKTDDIATDTIVLDDANPTKQFTYTLTVTNKATSNITATDVLVSDTLPSRLTPLSVTSTAGNCGLAGQTVVCELGDMIVGQQETISIKVSISRLPQGTASDAVITNIASVIAAEPETTYVDNTDDERLTITEVFPLIIESETLPATGADTDTVAMVAGLMLLMGGALVAGSHYRRHEGVTVDRLN